MTNKEKPTYYAILTADVRYSTKLKANEKLLFAEITALSQKDGTCWASNKYFAELYGVSTVSISNWVTNLVKYGFVSRTIKYKDGTKEIDKRYIRILGGGIKENFKGGIKENFKDNNTRVNNTRVISAFDDFWKEYPNKANKKKARTSFDRLTKTKQKLAIEDIKTRFIDIDNVRYVPHATTYINGERWEDEKTTTKIEGVTFV